MHGSNPFSLGHQANQFPRQQLTQWPPREPHLPTCINQANVFSGIPHSEDSPYITEPRFQFKGQSGPPINRPMFRSPFSNHMTGNTPNTEWNNNHNSFGTPRNRNSNNSGMWNRPPRVPFHNNKNPMNFSTQGSNFNQPCPPRSNVPPSINRPQSMIDNRLIQNHSTDNPPLQRFFNPTFGGQPQFDTGGARQVPRLFNRDGHF